jgi:crotonobetainyl-CoA:carnitine CoA-transferase CaiB-like acyl-CoA transferase
LRQRLAQRSAADIGAVFEAKGLPYAPITRPHDLFDDPHLLATGGLADVTLPASSSAAGREIGTRTALLPVTLGGERLGLRTPPPALGEHNNELLQELGYSASEIAALRADGILAGGTTSSEPATEPASA